MMASAQGWADGPLGFVIYCSINLVVAVALSPLFMGIIRKVKAFTQRRQGPSVFQPYYNLAKLLRKEVVYSSNSSWIMRASPYINIAAMLVSALFIPLVVVPSGSGWEGIGGIGNIVLFFYLLAVARFFMAIAGLDAGSTFGGMGSSREMSVSAIIEPVTVVVFAALVFVVKTTDIFGMVRTIVHSSVFSSDPALILISVSLFIVLITETARIPVDNPETHLELTMIHEAMILEQSGRNLALMETAHAIKQTLLMALLINVFFPWGISLEMSVYGILFSLAGFLVKGALLCVVIGLFESSLSKLRLFRLPGLFMLAFFLSMLTILVEVLA